MSQQEIPYKPPPLGNIRFILGPRETKERERQRIKALLLKRFDLHTPEHPIWKPVPKPSQPLLGQLRTPGGHTEWDGTFPDD